MFDLPNFNDWAGYFANESDSIISNSRYNALVNIKEELVKCQDINGYHDFWMLAQNMCTLIQDLFRVYGTHCEKRQDKMWWFQKYYKFPGYKSDPKYVDEYNEYEYLLGDLMYELARLANLLLSKIREHEPTFKAADGIFTFIGKEASFVKYRDDEISDNPYPGLEQFISVRQNRSFSFGKTTDILTTLRREKVIK